MIAPDDVLPVDGTVVPLNISKTLIRIINANAKPKSDAITIAAFLRNEPLFAGFPDLP